MADRIFDNASIRCCTWLQVLAPFAIGFTVFICHLIAIPIDGCSINREQSIVDYVRNSSCLRLGADPLAYRAMCTSLCISDAFAYKLSVLFPLQRRVLSAQRSLAVCGKSCVVGTAASHDPAAAC